MKRISQYVLALVVVFGSVCTYYAQKNKLNSELAPIEIVIRTPQDSCSKGDLSCMNNGDPFITEPVRYDLRNISKKSIRAYVIEFDRHRDKLVEIVSYRTGLPKSGETLYRGYTADRKESVSITFDYIEFDDGSTWGPDELGKSKEIVAYFSGFDCAVQRLKQLVKGTEAAEYFIQKASLFSAGSLAGQTGTSASENIKRAYALGYWQVVNRLQLEPDSVSYLSTNDKERNKKSKELAHQLELMKRDFDGSNFCGIGNPSPDQKQKNKRL